MITRSREPIYSSPAAAKRRRTNSTDAPEPPSHLSRIESLPTEILQLVFFASLNGNLLRASPRIAAKLSGSRNIYRTAFFIAFYHPHILELRDAFKFNYLLPDVKSPIPSWEVRSMQKIVLDSRWCTFGWFKSLASELLDYAYNLWRKVYAADVPPQSPDRTDLLPRDRDDLLALCDRACGAENAIGEYVELVIDPFNLSINIWPKEEEEEREEEDADQEYEAATRWHLQLIGIGSTPLRSDLLRGPYDEHDHFRLLVNETMLSFPGIKPPHPKQTDRWEYLETSMLDAILKEQVLILQGLLEINYFFWPEDAPFKLSPRLFIAAAQQDGDEMLYLLFQVDPTSMPRNERNLRWTAKYLEDHSIITKEDRLAERMKRREHRANGGVYSEEALRLAAQLDCWREYTEQLDEAIAHYVWTGCLMGKHEPLSPDFLVRTRHTRMEGICESRLFGCEEDRWLAEKSEHVCSSAKSQEAYDSDLDDWPPWDEFDLKSWTGTDGLDMYDTSALGEDEYPVQCTMPSGLDWVSLSVTRGDDWLLRMDRKEDYHYMML
jgi:hypothetical protein